MLAKQKANISFILLSRSKLFRPNSLRIDSKQTTFRERHGVGVGIQLESFFKLLIFMNEKEVPVCLMSLFKPGPSCGMTCLVFPSS